MRLERRWQGREGEREEGRKRNTLLARISPPRGELSMVSLKLWVARGDVLRLALLEMGGSKRVFYWRTTFVYPIQLSPCPRFTQIDLFFLASRGA